MVATQDAGGTTHGIEYLDLYRRVDFSTLNRLAAWRPGTDNGVVLVTI
ncbi:protein of unknown function [uncultured Sphingopyxis sp.]|uniref:Uncharacterized protein n=1 Tax=uncultured Sphingopyxis sp. TaxID=310581 RepID=A0A1Y5PYV1_9SPHN|nr:hypothetical protein [uncultured Sphingopyxis sp.]SBV32687.1 protein of unknown function [uncultured Sphingopyxis sp.]